MQKIVTISNEAAMLDLGRLIAKHCSSGSIIFLSGELGAGKTTFTRGFLREFGHIGTIKSPTYTLVEEYRLGEKVVFHFDLYRLGDPDELIHIGLADYVNAKNICLIEWPERGLPLLPLPDLRCELRFSGEGRTAILQAITQKGENMLIGVHI
jgi:tRNA threonylcarbamoyladenosine biosynthesis protein TsaE